MALRKLLVGTTEHLFEKVGLGDVIIAGLASGLICLEYGSSKSPVTSVVCSSVAGAAVGFLWPVLAPGAITYHLWQENKGRILAKHHHRWKKELWVDDFLFDMDE